jgi:1-aminocyclopropane-1-carboxylate deaminase/D-cysteine desulfhydrase-like pyridoxal-dependent ACC family enzyme
MARLPTPLHRARNLEARVAPRGPEVRLKRDDETGFALGGNKVRKLEYELAPARLEGVTHLVTTGGPHSNHARVTAGAAAALGLECVLVIDGEPDDPTRGNALLHRSFGARIVTVGHRDERAPTMARIADSLRGQGGRAHIVPLGASTPRGALGYIRAAVELDAQLPHPPRAGRSWIVLSSSSGGTLAGLVAGFRLLDRDDVHLLAVSADVPREHLRERALGLASETLELLGSSRSVDPDRVHVTDDQVGPGYGIDTPASREASALLARTEAVLLDPVYTGKAGAELLAGLRDGRFADDERVVFWHTGGHPALFR